MKSSKIVIVTHKLPNTHPYDELVNYLNKNKYSDVFYIMHSFSDSPDRKSKYIWYKNGKTYRKHEGKDYIKYPEPIIYIKEFWFTLHSIVSSRVIFDTYLGMDGLCALFGLTLKFFRRVKKVIYWAIDFVPNNRFDSPLKNKIYHAINTLGYKHADEMWDLSPRMAEAREKFLGFKEDKYKYRKVVPYGMWIDRIKKVPYQDCNKNEIVFMGHLLEKQGAQLVIEALPAISKANPNITFKIIGDGPYKDSLEELSKSLRIEDRCEFTGRILNHEDVEAEIAKSAVAVAPYIKELDTWSYYADPGKVKTYLACGVPVVLTDIPWNAKEIQEKKCGYITDGSVDDLAKKVLDLLNAERNSQFRENAIDYSKSYDYNSIFPNLNL